MINAGTALPYFEPESTVISRTGEECIVALTDQWYIPYGEPDWQALVSGHLHGSQFNGFNDKIMEKFDQVLGWLKEWACSRQFGLGTKLPWDNAWVIESLSDSTIYMAYYTIAHYFHGDLTNLSGSKGAPINIKPEDLTDDVFSYIFLKKPFPEDVTSNVSIDILNKMREEFEYWYPIDLRVSAKDLIQNHLTMFLYHHTEIWKDFPEMWPRGIYCNGHIMVDAEKMSKSKGNFLMMLECVEEFTADATRFALADAGDSMEDANFDRAVANQAISYLYVEEDWIKQMVSEISASNLRKGEMMFMDKAFDNEMDYSIEATCLEYSKMCYRDGLHRCWFDLMIVRDMYRDWTIKCGIPMHEDIITRFMDAIVVMMAPITPHWCENCWGILKKQGSVCNTSWPIYTTYDRDLRKQYIFFSDFMKNIRQANIRVKATGPHKHVQVYISSVFESKKISILKFMQPLFDPTIPNKFPTDLLKMMKDFVENDSTLKKDTKILMQFGAFMRDEAVERGYDALATEMTFDQKLILQVCLL
jgi:leucyl-tRNA synthetase